MSNQLIYVKKEKKKIACIFVAKNNMVLGAHVFNVMKTGYESECTRQSNIVLGQYFHKVKDVFTGKKPCSYLQRTGYYRLPWL